MEDPLDVSRTNRPGGPDSMMGASPDFWHNLSNFGLSTIVAANARNPNGFLTYGSGSSGPIAAGLLGAQNMNMQNASDRSQMNYRDMETLARGTMLPYDVQEKALSVLQKQALFPYQLKQQELANRIAQKDYEEGYGGGAPSSGAPPAAGFGPGFAPGMGAGARAGAAGPTPTPPGGQKTYADMIAGTETAGERSPATATNPMWPAERGGPVGAHQIVEGTWKDLIKKNPDLVAGLDQSQYMTARTDPERSARGTDAYARENAGVLAAANLPVTNQSLGIMHSLGPGDGVALLKAPPEMPMIQALAARDPTHAAKVAQQNHIYTALTVGQFMQKYAPFNSAAPIPGVAYTPVGGSGAVTAPGGPPPAQVQQRVSAADGPIPGGATPVAATPIAPPAQGQPQAQPAPAGDGNSGNPNQDYVQGLQQQIADARRQEQFYTSRAKAAQWAGKDGAPELARAKTFGDIAVKLTERLSTPLEMRPGQRIQTPGGATIGEQPEWVPTVDPNTGVPGKVLATSRGPMPGSFVPTGMAKGWEIATEQASKRYDEMGKTFEMGQGGLQSLAGMEDHLRSLSKNGGFLAPGAFIEARGNIARTMNTLFTQFGFKEMFNPDKVASWEDLMKETSRLGFQFVSSFLGQQREAAQTIERGVNSVPGAHLTPEGSITVLNGIREVMKRQLDEYAFKTQWLQDPSHKGSLIGSDIEFAKERSAEAYARRAISQVHPYEVKDQRELARYLPGTLVTPVDPATGKAMISPTTGKPVIRPIQGAVDLWRGSTDVGGN